METEKKKSKLLLRIISYIVVAALSSTLTLLIFVPLQVTARAGKLGELKALIEKCFIGDVDETYLEDVAAAAMVTATGDRWSYYVAAKDLQTVLDSSANSYVGIGVTGELLENNGGYRIQRIEPNSPARDADLRPGDLVVGAEGKSIQDIGSDSMMDLISGEEGTTVRLTLQRDGETLEKTLTRRRILQQVASGIMLTDTVGYIQINNFNERCADETIALFKELEGNGAQAMIFDVRFNPGGYVKEMVAILDYLLPEGVLFRSEDYNGKTTIEKSDAACKTMPMAVLINGESYSAAEFFAAALQEYDYAITVGQPTTGKGRFQQLIPLSDGSAVNLSVGKYSTPNGVDLSQQGGLTPDVTVEIDEETMSQIYSDSLPYDQDAQLQAALAALQ